MDASAWGWGPLGKENSPGSLVKTEIQKIFQLELIEIYSSVSHHFSSVSSESPCPDPFSQCLSSSINFKTRGHQKPNPLVLGRSNSKLVRMESLLYVCHFWDPGKVLVTKRTLGRWLRLASKEAYPAHLSRQFTSPLNRGLVHLQIRYAKQPQGQVFHSSGQSFGRKILQVVVPR